MTEELKRVCTARQEKLKLTRQLEQKRAAKAKADAELKRRLDAGDE